MTTVRPAASAFGWLTVGVVEIVTDRLPCATAQAPSVTDSFSTTEPVRALRITFAAGLDSVTGRFSMSAMKATRRSVSTGMLTRTMRASTATAVPGPLAWLMACATELAVW